MASYLILQVNQAMKYETDVVQLFFSIFTCYCKSEVLDMSNLVLTINSLN